MPGLLTEHFRDNTQYGNSNVLRTYSGYRKPIAAVIPHGVDWTDHIYPGEAYAPVPAVLSYPAYRDEAWSAYKTVIPSAAPFLYALALVEGQERAGTVVMPAHGTTLIELDTDWYAMAKACADLPGPVTVCLHWHEMKDCARFFAKRGYEVVCMGDGDEQMFLFRLAKLLLRAEWVVSNDVSSHMPYSIAAGANFVWPNTGAWTPPSYLYRGPMDMGGLAAKEAFCATSDIYATMRSNGALFSDFVPTDDKKRTMADYLLRRECFKTPEGLLADLEYAESLMK